MVKDMSFLKSGYEELISSVRRINKDIAEQKEKLSKLESKKNVEYKNLKAKIKEHLFSAIEDDAVRNFLSLPVYQPHEGGGLHPHGDILGNLHELYVDEEEIRLGDIWGFGEYRYMYIKIDAVRTLGLTPTQKGLAGIFHKILWASDNKLKLEIYDAEKHREKKDYIYLRGCNRFKGEIVIE